MCARANASTTTTTEASSLAPSSKATVLEFTYPPGSHEISIFHWETKATLHAIGFPESLTICTSIFLKSWVDYWTYVYLFSINDQDGYNWAWMYLITGTKNYDVSVHIGKGDNSVYFSVSSNSPFFPQKWYRVCLSLDIANGTAKVVVDGNVLEDASYVDLKKVADTRPQNFSIKVGFGHGIHSKWANMNMFMKPLSVERMVAMTSAGGQECGAPGDFLSWQEMEWELSNKWAKDKWEHWVLGINSSAVVEVEVEEGPCWPESRTKVYQLDQQHSQAYCMEHCQKVGGGRAAPVVTEEQWEQLQEDILAISPHNDHCNIWLPAIEGEGEVGVIAPSLVFPLGSL